MRDGMRVGSEVVPVAAAIMAALVLYGSIHMKVVPDMKILVMMLLPPSLLALHLSGSRQDAKIRELYRSGEKYQANLHALDGRLTTASRPLVIEKMTANRYNANRYNAPPHDPPRRREYETVRPSISPDTTHDLRTITAQNEQHDKQHPGVRNANGYAPSRRGEADLIHATSHMEDTPSFYAHSSNARSQQRTNMPNGHAFNTIASADAPGEMRLGGTNDGDGHGRQVDLSYASNVPERGLPQQPLAPPPPAAAAADPLARLFQDTAVSNDMSDGDVEQLKEGRMN
jgi:hypothetical protein